MMGVELRLDMLGLLSTILIIILTLVVKWILRPYEECEKPVVYLNENSNITKEVIKNCTRLNEIYNPTYFWGKNGHFQTLLHAAFGRFGEKVSPIGKLHTLYAADGATITYMFYDSDTNGSSIGVAKKDNLILIVPGIANYSNTIYIRAFSSLFLKSGFDVVVYNHLGAHPKIKITSPRLFTYGCTDDLEIVIKDLMCKFPKRKFIGLGFSMGANVLLKYLGEKPARQENFPFAVSICQGYDCTRAMPFMREWRGLRRFYSWAISRNVKKLITRKHRESFVEFERKGLFKKMDWRKISSSSSLEELDMAITKRFASFDDVDEFYRWGSSANYANKIHIPMFMLNALDDPLIPERLFEAPKKIVEEKNEAVFVVTKHGGHLGFYEGGLVWPNQSTWLEHTLLEYIVAMDDAVQSPKAEYNGNEDAIKSRKCFSL